MENKSVEIDVLRNKLNNNIRSLEHPDTVECNENLSKDERMKLIGYYLGKLSGYQKVTVEYPTARGWRSVRSPHR